MRGFVTSIVFSILIIGICGALFTRPPSKAEMANRYLPGEPTCAELRIMWKFSKRQSRASEVTNELPTYRDPFARNIWEPLPRYRGGLQKSNSRPWSPPVYGRIVRHPPAFPPRPSAFDELFREYHKDFRNDDVPEWGGDDEEEYRPYDISPNPRYNNLDYDSPYNNFDRVKQMILAERAKDPTYQKVKQNEAQAAKNTQTENKEEVNDQNNHSKQPTEEEEKDDKFELAKGDLELIPFSGSERYRKPLRRSSAYTWMDPSLGEGYW